MNQSQIYRAAFVRAFAIALRLQQSDAQVAPIRLPAAAGVAS
jgi:hypothetical protein